MPKAQLFITCLGHQFYTSTLQNMTYILERPGVDQSYHFGHALAALHAAADIWSMSIDLVKGPIDGFECFDDGFFDSRLTWLRESVAIYRGMGNQRATDSS